MQRGQTDCSTDFAGKFQMRRARHALNGNDIRQPRIGIDVTANDIQEIYHSGVTQTLGNAQAILSSQSSFEQLVRSESNADNEL